MPALSSGIGCQRGAGGGNYSGIILFELRNWMPEERNPQLRDIMPE